MSLKPLNQTPDPVAEQQKIAEALNAAPPETIDSTLVNDPPSDLEPGYDPEEVLAKMKADQQQKEVGHTLHTKEFYEDKKGFVPSMEITPPPSKTKKKTAEPATEIDLENLDESMIMDMPQIRAASFELNNFLDLKFKDKTLRGRWANCKNYVQGNLHRFLQLGYEVASVQDIDETRTPVDISMIDGTQIKYHDVVLLKIGVVRLMELYKEGILKSQDRLVRTKEKGLAEANQQFARLVSEAPGATKAYNEFKHAHGGKEPVSFSIESD